MSTKIVRAVDVGYGSTKFTLHTQGGIPHFSAFRSVARDERSKNFLNSKTENGLKPVSISVNEQEYIVGFDDGMLRGTKNTRILHDAYIHSPEHLALLKGAISYMSVESIDMLVLGLPVSYIAAKSKDLVQLIKGEQTLAGNRLCTIKDVWVVPQPLGSLYNFVVKNKAWLYVKNSHNLVIDIGYYTIDWTLSNGLNMLAESSASLEFGISKALQELAILIGEDQGTRITDLMSLDLGIRYQNYKLFGKTVNLSPYLEQLEKKLLPVTNEILNSVGSANNVDNIILTGGGSYLFQGILTKRFNREVLHIDDPVYSNVRGFQLVGEQLIKSRQKEVA